MRAIPILYLLLFLSFAPSAEAHRLNEYLQATTIALGGDSAVLHLELTAGSDIAEKVLAGLDPDGNGIFSAAEQQHYVNIVLNGLSVNVDGHPVLLRLQSWSFPSAADIKKGTGSIELYAAAYFPGKGNHVLTYTSRAEAAAVVYLVNCLQPTDPGIRVTGQSRNNDQSIYSLGFFRADDQTAVEGQHPMQKENGHATLWTFFFHGIRHILTGYDHLLFLCALVLGAAGLWDLIKVVTAFTLAHSITLTLATFGLAHLPEYIVEPFISASIVFVAVQNIFYPRQANGTERLAIAFFFGLFHGLGFAGGLLELLHAMPSDLIIYAILGFSLGVEAGNQLVLLPLYGMLKGGRRLSDKAGKPTGWPTIRQVASGGVAIGGLYYLCIAL